MVHVQTEVSEKEWPLWAMIGFIFLAIGIPGALENYLKRQERMAYVETHLRPQVAILRGAHPEDIVFMMDGAYSRVISRLENSTYVRVSTNCGKFEQLVDTSDGVWFLSQVVRIVKKGSAEYPEAREEFLRRCGVLTH